MTAELAASRQAQTLLEGATLALTVAQASEGRESREAADAMVAVRNALADVRTA